jgi:CubicO group peptidase (beta-lactamase class C family)
VIQAGAINRTSITVKDAFAGHPAAWRDHEIVYYAHDVKLSVPAFCRPHSVDVKLTRPDFIPPVEAIGRSEHTMKSIRGPSRRHILKTTMALAAAGTLSGRDARALPHEAPSRAGTFPHIDTGLRAAVAAQEIPGVVALAATDNGILYEGVFGSRRFSGGPAKDAAMTRDTVFRIASMVKLITSVAAMRLVEQGKLSLDAPAPVIDPAVADAQVLDGFDASGAPIVRPPKRPIALRHLLTHTSGFTYRLWDAEAIRYGNAVEKVPLPDRAKLPRTPLMFDPGERWQYGTSIDWVGRIIEAVSGEPLETHFRKNIFEPLGMKDTTFEITLAQRTREASAHRRQPDGSLRPEPMEAPPQPHAPPRHHSGGGGIYSTAPDYLTLIRMLMHGGSFEGARILQPETVALMGQNQIGPVEAGILKTTAPRVSNDVDFFHGISLKWGFGHMINMQAVPQARSAGSMTWAGLFNTYYWIDPRKRVAAVFMTQVLPFADERALQAYRQFERGVYAAVKTG